MWAALRWHRKFICETFMWSNLGGNYSPDAQGKTSNDESESRFPQQVQPLSSFILATFRDLLIKGGFWTLYDGKTWLNRNAGSWDEAAGCTLGEAGRKSHQPNHRKLITADKMAAATKTGAGESSVRTGRSRRVRRRGRDVFQLIISIRDELN